MVVSSPTLLAQATEDYRRSIALLEELLAASPGDAKLRRYLADAVGVCGMGCCFRFADRNEEAESWYRRAIELRRDLVRGTGSGGVDTGARADVAGEVSNFSLLVNTVQILAGMLEGRGPTGGSRGPAPPTGGRCRRAGGAVLGARVPGRFGGMLSRASDEGPVSRHAGRATDA